MSEIIPNEVKQEPMDTELELEKLDLDPDGDIILVIEGQKEYQERNLPLLIQYD